MRTFFAAGRFIIAMAAVSATALCFLSAPAAAQTAPVLPAQTDKVIFYGEKFFITPVASGQVTYSARLSDGRPLLLEDLTLNTKTGEIVSSPLSFFSTGRGLLSTVTIEVQATDSNGLRSDKQSFELVQADYGGRADEEIVLVGVGAGGRITLRVPLDPSICGRAYDKISLFLDDDRGDPSVREGITGCGNAVSTSTTDTTIVYDTAGKFVEIRISGQDHSRYRHFRGYFLRAGVTVAGFRHSVPAVSGTTPLQFSNSSDPLVISIDENPGSSTTAALTELATITATSSNTNLTISYEVRSGLGAAIAGIRDHFCITDRANTPCGSGEHGVLKTVATVNFDYENKAAYTLMVRAYAQTRVRGAFTTHEIFKKVILNINNVAETAPAFSPDGSDMTLTLSSSLTVGSPVLTLTATSAGMTVDWGISQADRRVAYRIDNGPATAVDTYLATVVLDSKDSFENGRPLRIHPHFIKVAAANDSAATGRASRNIFLIYETPPSFTALHQDRRYTVGSDFEILVEKAFEIKFRNRGGDRQELREHTFTSYSATLADGTPLPSWLELKGTHQNYWKLVATRAAAGSLRVRINALNADGEVVVSDEFAIEVASPASRSGLIRLISHQGTGALNISESDLFEGEFTVSIDSAPVGVPLRLQIGSQSHELELSPEAVGFAAGAGPTERSQMIDASIVGSGRSPGAHSAVVRIWVLDPSTAPANYIAAEILTVTLTWNIPNIQPVFSGAVVDVDENQGRQTTPAGTTIAVIPAATDANGDQLQYTVLGAPGGMFAISRSGETSAAIVTREAVNFNHEAVARHVLAVQVQDPGGASVLATVTINLVDLDEAPDPGGSLVTMAVRKPRVAWGASWNNSGYHASLGPEDRSHIVISYVDADDPSLTGSTTLAQDATSGVVAGLVPGTDYKMSVLWVSEDGLAAASSEISASTAANTPPVVNRPVVAVTVAENVALSAGEALFDLSGIVSDDDGDELSFVAVLGDLDVLTVDRQSGEISMRRGAVLDAETDSFLVLVAIGDGYGGGALVPVNLVVEGENEPPVFPEVEDVLVASQGSATTFTLPEAEDPESDNLTHSVDASDLISGITFTAASRELEIGASVAAGVYQIRYKAQESSTADQFEAMNTYQVIVAADPATLPTFGARQTYEFPENRGAEFTAAGTAVLTAAINNSGAVGGNVSYQLIGSDSEIGPFAIGASDGIIMVARATNFDLESKGQYVFVVRATVAGSATGFADRLVTLELSGVNEPPRFGAITTSRRLVRGVETRIILPVSDHESDGTEYVFDESVLPAGVRWNGTIGAFDVEAGALFGSYVLTVTVREVAVTTNLDVVTLTLQIRAAGNEAPQFASSQAEFTVLENREGGVTAAGKVVGRVAADDPDENVLAYSIAPGSDSGPFAVDEASGAIMLATDHSFRTAEQARWQFSVQASDLLGGMDTVAVAVAVLENKEANKEMVSIVEIDSAIAAAVVDLIGQRLSAGVPARAFVQAQGGEEMRPASAEEMWSGWRLEEGAGTDRRMRRMGLREFIHERGFDFALSASEHGPQTRLWGSGNIVVMDGNPVVDGTELSYDGDVNVLMLGVEAVRGNSRLGLAVGSSDAEIDFGENGSIERKMTSIHPYLSWQPREQIQVWLSAGIGGGLFDNKQSGSEKHGRDAKYVMFAGGVSRGWKQDEYDIFLGGKVFSGTSRLEASDELDLAEAKARSWRVEAEVRAERDFAMPDQGLSLRPFVSIDGRRDHSDTASVNAFDVGGGVQANWDLGMQLEVSGRWQVNDEVANEKSVGGSFSYDFGSDGQGLLLSLAPEVVQSREEDDSTTFRRTLRSRVGYALPVRIFGQSATMQVNADASYGAAGESRDYGWRLAGRRTSIGVAVSGSGTYRVHWSWR